MRQLFLVSESLENPSGANFKRTLARLGIKPILTSPGTPIPTNSIIVTLGERCLHEATNNSNLKLTDVHNYCLPVGNDTIIIPTFAPETIFRQPEYAQWVDSALKRANRLALGDANLDEPITYRLRPEPELVTSYFALASQSKRPVAVDIECVPETTEITAIAFAISPTDAISIPLAGQYLSDYWSPEEERCVWLQIARFLAGPSHKVFQNFIFDTMILRQYGCETRGLVEDTLVIANLLNPLLPKGLIDLARIYCYCEPWKKNNDFKLTGDPIEFWRYNAQDAARTLQIYHKQQAELDARNLRQHYETYVKPLTSIVYDTCVRGMPIDSTALSAANTKLNNLLAPLESELQALANPFLPPKITTKRIRDKTKDEYGTSEKTGKKIITQKGYTTIEERTPREYNPRSPDQTKEVLELMGFRIPTKKGKASTDREALLKLNRKAPSDFVTKLLLHSKLAKLRSSYTGITLDPDARCRFSFNIGGTISGRFSSQKTPWGTGLNIQTLPRTREPINMRSVFIPDSGMTLLQVDLSQAELRVVAWLAGETKLIELMASGQDVHQFTADRVSELSGLECPRQLGKRINHASNYGMGPEKFADSCLLEADMSISVDTARKLLNARSATFPAIARWHASIESQLNRTRQLTSPHGRTAYFYGMVTPDMIRQGLSFIPQATVVDTLNHAWIRLTAEPAYNRDFHVYMQGHDSLLMGVKRDKLGAVVALVNKAFSEEWVIINNIRYQIPHDITIGDSWGALKELKK